jgi:hypothetical protein
MDGHSPNIPPSTAVSFTIGSAQRRRNSAGKGARQNTELNLAN